MSAGPLTTDAEFEVYIRTHASYLHPLSLSKCYNYVKDSSTLINWKRVVTALYNATANSDHISAEDLQYLENVVKDRKNIEANETLANDAMRVFMDSLEIEYIIRKNCDYKANYTQVGWQEYNQNTLETWSIDSHTPDCILGICNYRKYEIESPELSGMCYFFTFIGASNASPPYTFFCIIFFVFWGI